MIKTKLNIDYIINELVEARKEVDVNHNLDGVVNSNLSNASAERILNNIKNLMKHSRLTLTVFNEAKDDIISNSMAISKLESACINDVNNGYFDTNVIDSKQLERVANDNKPYYVSLSSNAVRNLEPSDVANVLSNIAFDDIDNNKFQKVVKAHSIKDYELLKRL